MLSSLSLVLLLAVSSAFTAPTPTFGDDFYDTTSTPGASTATTATTPPARTDPTDTNTLNAQDVAALLVAEEQQEEELEEEIEEAILASMIVDELLETDGAASSSTGASTDVPTATTPLEATTPTEASYSTDGGFSTTGPGSTSDWESSDPPVDVVDDTYWEEEEEGSGEGSGDSSDVLVEQHSCHVLAWFHSLPFGLRVVVAAAFSFVTGLVLYGLFRCCRACCCDSTAGSALPTHSKTVYLDNIKMHYSRLPTNDREDNNVKVVF